MEIFVNRLLEFCLNNTINLLHLTPHIMLYCAYTWRSNRGVDAVTSLHPMLAALLKAHPKAYYK